MTPSRLALLGPFTWDPLVARLQDALRERGLTDEVVGFGFGRDVQVWAGHDAEFEARPPRGAVVVPDGRALLGPVLSAPDASTPQSVGVEHAMHLVGAVAGTARRHPEIAWILSTAVAPLPNSGDGVADPELDPFTAALNAFNAELRRACREHGWSLFDRGRLGSLWGEVRMHDARMDLLARFPASADGLRWLAERLASHWGAVQGQVKKVLALDCDNTLWGGIVGEDGVDGLRLGGDGIGRAFTEFQQALAILERRGVLLALCSRNNPADVEEVFARRPEMVLARARFAAVHVGWGSKVDGLLALSSRLGLGLDAFVFVDDNPVERAAVRQALPAVAVPEFPAEVADLPAFGYHLGWRYFYRLRLGDEDRARTEQYRRKEATDALRARAGSEADFLKSLEMTSTVACNSMGLVARGAELTQKTNQFNLTLRRYTEAEMRACLADRRRRTFLASLTDRFGNHGWTALAIVERAEDPPRWQVDTFLLSCRVLGRGFEHAFLDACIGRLRQEAALPVRAYYCPGPRNQPAAAFYQEAGFRKLAGDSEPTFELPAAESPRVPCRNVEFHWSEEAHGR